ILIVASDIARYGLNTPGESSQGAGAIAMLLSSDPRVVAIEPESGFYAEDVMDFWRPNYRDEALVDGKYSCDLYLKVLEKVWSQYSSLSGRSFQEHDYFCYHTAVPKLVVTAHKRLARLNQSLGFAADTIDSTLYYGREVGNCYAAALYISLLSLMATIGKDIANRRIGFYSYGAGCVGEYFSGVVQPGYQKMLAFTELQQLLTERINLSYKEYEKFYNFKLPVDGSAVKIPRHTTGVFRLAAMEAHKRIYKRSE
ncbi:MAG: hydroxymethylglutaryl-CoA synthase, partial [Gammaproteobacteria bacterium]|nr:hydroxymethylglutaryl-CoA synthase [Gammaproteobacteria bacterium]